MIAHYFGETTAEQRAAFEQAFVPNMYTPAQVEQLCGARRCIRLPHSHDATLRGAVPRPFRARAMCARSGIRHRGRDDRGPRHAEGSSVLTTSPAAHARW
jgi:hypothetical protein